MSEALSDGAYAVIASLRNASDERQTTRALHAFASADRSFAAAFMCLLIEVAGSAGEPYRQRASELPRQFGNVSSQRERATGGVDAGRCDLWFTAETPSAFTLAVELKHYARYTPRQLERYLSELRRRVAGTSALVVLTGRAPSRQTATVLGDHRWLGEIGWETLLESGLAELPFDDDELANLWRAFVAKLRDDGDLGAIATFNPARFAQWATGAADVSWSNAEKLLASVASDAKERLDRRLSRRGLRPRVIPGNEGGALVYVRSRGYVSLTFSCSARGSEEVQLVLQQSTDDDPRAHIEVWFFPRPSQKKLRGAQARRRGAFRWDEVWQGWLTTTRLEMVETPKLREQLLLTWDSALRSLDRIGGFDELTSTPT